MANIKSQIKRNRQNEKRRLRNKAVKSEIKTDVEERYRLAQKRIDMAVAKGILHKKTAARRKSRLAKRIAAAR